MKNKIYNYDFLIIGAGLIGSLAAIALHKKNFNVLVIDKNNHLVDDHRTLAVNANSREFLKSLNLWKNLEKKSEAIEKIIILDDINNDKVIFEDKDESMGSVIFNAELQKISRSYLHKNKILINNIDFAKIDISSLNSINIKNKIFSFKKIIFALGRNFKNDYYLKKSQFKVTHKAYVGFFKHEIEHSQTAYETFTSAGPLAVLPCPHKNKKLSTFIYSTPNKISKKNLSSKIFKYFSNTHGKIQMKNQISEFPIIAHLSKPIKENIFLIGDNSRAIHPVAGQGWNLGIKDIQALLQHLDKYPISHKKFDEIYFAKRQIENFSYLVFTNTLNYIYDSDSILSKKIRSGGFAVLNNFSFLRKLFINQAMGKKYLI